MEAFDCFFCRWLDATALTGLTKVPLSFGRTLAPLTCTPKLGTLEEFKCTSQVPREKQTCVDVVPSGKLISY